jgi:ankyrin repeat protein
LQILSKPGLDVTELVGVLIDKGVKPNEPNKQGDTPLIKAVRQGNLKAAQTLVKKISDVEKDPQRIKDAIGYRNNKGYSALHEATIWGKLDFVKWLLDSNLIDPNVTDNDGNTPLHLAGDRKLSGAYYSTKQQMEFVRVLIEHGASPNLQNKAGNTPLHTTECSQEFLELLLECGARVDIVNSENESPLDKQLKAGKIYNFDLLLKHTFKLYSSGNSIDQTALNDLIENVAKFRTATGNNVLHLLVESDLIDSLHLLLSHPKSSLFDLNQTNHTGETLVDVALRNHSLYSLTYLLKEKKLKLDLNKVMTCVDNEGNSILHKAVACDYAEGVRVFLECGVPVNIDNAATDSFTDGGQPIHVAACKGAIKSMPLLISKDPTCVNSQANLNRDSPLHFAVKFGHKECVEILLKNGADPELRNADGNTALKEAEIRGEKAAACLQLLQNHIRATTIH